MKKEDLLKEMRASIDAQYPIEYFKKFVDVFEMLFSRIESLEMDLKSIKKTALLSKRNSALSIQWEPKIAADMLTEQIDVLRKDKETYMKEITDLKTAYTEGKVVQQYDTFCKFWVDTLGWHPFLDY